MDKDLFEEVLNKKRLYEGRKLNLDIIEAKLPNGEKINREVVRRKPNAVILAIKENRQVVLVKQYRHSFNEPILSLPAGKMDEGETIIETAKRELEEETGYIANSLTSLGTFKVAPAYSDELCTAFLAQDLTKGQIKRDKDEFLEVVEIPFYLFTAYCLNGTISDMRSALACFRYLVK